MQSHWSVPLFSHLFAEQITERTQRSTQPAALHSARSPHQVSLAARHADSEPGAVADEPPHPLSESTPDEVPAAATPDEVPAAATPDEVPAAAWCADSEPGAAA
eukprot:Hpha_TRINITY_DN16162_c1_g7::TRINITY_DN16162_c1_g7_i1::g.9061::m.9061